MADAILNLNDKPVISAQIRMPRVGVWSADLTVDDSSELPATSTIATDDGSFELMGTDLREGVFLENLRTRIVGGAGKLDAPIGPKAYNGYSVRSVLTDTLSVCGEKLASTTDSSLLNKFLKKWVRMGGTGKRAIQALMLFAGAESWRILPDGTFWAGTETWPAIQAHDFEVASRSYAEGWVIIQSERPFALPGYSLTLPEESGGDTIRISNVVHLVSTGVVESRLWVEDSFA